MQVQHLVSAAPLFSPLFFTLIGFGIAVGLAFFEYCRRKDESMKQGIATLGDALLRDVKQIDASLLARVHALENGGHLSSGTAQILLDKHVGAVSGTNGGQPASTLTPATT